jgi:Ser-tRNA(Ala) deacylase AlaX
LAADPEHGIVLDRSAFYPGGGGQPPDEGVLLWDGVRTRIVGTRKGDDLYLIAAEGDPLPPAGTAVRGALDDDRRTALMRTHSGLHVLTGVVFRDYGALVTGGNMEPMSARMDFDLAEVPADFKDRVAESCNAEIRTDRRIEVTTLPRAEAFAIPDIIRTATNLIPPEIEGWHRRHSAWHAGGRCTHGVNRDDRPPRSGQDGEQGPPSATRPSASGCEPVSEPGSRVGRRTVRIGDSDDNARHSIRTGYAVLGGSHDVGRGGQ